MFLQVQLKVCEGCGSLWFRAQNWNEVYCGGCRKRLEAFPSPGSRKKRGRPSRRNAALHTNEQQRVLAGGAL